MPFPVAAARWSQARERVRRWGRALFTNRRDREAALWLEREQAEQRAAALDAILQSVAEPLGVTDARGVLVRTNPAFERLFGPQESWRGLGLSERARLLQIRTPEGEVVPIDRLPGSRALAGQAVAGELHQVQAADGSVRHVSASAAPIRTTAGVVGAALVFTDLTDRVLAEQALREADRRKDRFLAVLSHELRNPLAPIRNCLFLLERTAPGSDQAKRAHQILDRQVGVLTRLVEDLLDVTRITSGKIQLQRTVLALGTLLRSVVEDHRSLFEQAGVQLDLTPEQQILRVNGDRIRLTQAVGNLLQNAAKFTPRGGLVTAALEADRAAGRAVIRIADTGIGMAPELLARLFEPFSQGDGSLDRSGGGLGLGLALVKGLVELHGGEVQATSLGLGRGTEFTVSLPLAEEETRPAAVPGPEGKAGRRVLIIEDNPDAADSLREVLRFLGDHQVDVAHSGPEGVARAREVQPEVVFCDIGLPGMDGYEVARAIRADATLGSAFLVALSGYAYPEDLERSRCAGFERHLAKPATLEALAELLATVGRTTRDVQ